MYIVKNPEDLYLEIQNAVANQLQDIIEVMPFLAQNIKDNVLWGIFSEDEMYKPKKTSDSIFNLPYSLVLNSAQEVNKALGIKNPHFFSKEVEEAFEGKQFDVFLEYEDCEVEIIAKAEDNTLIRNKESQIVIAPTLPDSTIIFQSLVKGDFYSPGNDWIFAYMDLYDEWRHNLMEKLYRYYYQVGGHGRWVQNDYNGTYVAQINNDIGDAGSVFISLENGKIVGYVDMH